jgi:hypothetical protein
MAMVSSVRIRLGVAALFTWLVGFPSSSALAQCVEPPSGLVSWWRGEGDANDFVGANHGGAEGNVAFATGAVGAGFSFDGTGFVSVPDHASLDLTNEITLELWFNYTDVNVIRGLIAKRAQPGDLSTNYGINAVGSSPFGFELGLGLYYNDPSVVGGDDFDTVGSPFEAARIPLPVAGAFHHFAGTYRQVDASQLELKLFVDGQLIETKSIPGNLASTLNDAAVTIGADFAGESLFSGILDEVTLYNRALAAQEVEAIFAAGAAGKCTVTTLIVSIDIKPGSFPNSINLGSRGRVPVAILSTAAFDARTVDPLSVTLAGASVHVKGKGAATASLEDVDGDGLVDLVVHVDTEALQLTDVDNEAVLTGSTFDGTPIKGTDTIRVVP